MSVIIEASCEEGSAVAAGKGLWLGQLATTAAVLIQGRKEGRASEGEELATGLQIKGAHLGIWAEGRLGPTWVPVGSTCLLNEIKKGLNPA